MRVTGPVRHRRARRGQVAGLEPSPVAVRPPLGRGPADSEVVRGSGNRPAVLDDQPPDPKALNRGQSSVSVGHEDLLVTER